MTTRAIVVAGCDDGYFAYLQELLHSFVACGAERKYDFGVIDAGLAADQVEWLRRFGVAAIVRPAWPFAGLDGQPEWYKACLCRPFFPDYFRDWDVIAYLDADSWLQDCEALDLAVAAALQDGFAALPIVDRSLWPLRVETNAVFSMRWHKDCLVQYFGQEVADQYQLHPIIAAGFFAGRRDAPHWNAWRTRMEAGLRRKVHFNVDQASLTLAIHQTGLPTQFLPLASHWIGHLGPVGLDTRSGAFVEPYLPHRPVSSLGLAAHTKTEPVLAHSLDGRLLSRHLRYSRRHQRFDTKVTLNGTAHSFDGIATRRFLQRVLEAVGSVAPVRFVQIGAMDGVSFDPIHAAMVRYGWSGILVEPMPDLMARLRQNLEGCAGLRFAELAIAERTERRTMHRVRAQAVAGGAVPPWAAGLASLAPERNALGGAHITAEQHAAIAAEIVPVEVDCIDFAEFERRYGVAGFDVLQIDAEGYDWRILSQIDLPRHAPKCVHLETECLPEEEVGAAIARLRQSAYACYAMEDGRNLLAIRHDFAVAHFGAP